MAASVRILHAHSSFSLGGKEARAVRLMNAFGGGVEHTILSAVPQALDARAAIDAGVAARFPDDRPSLAGPPSLSRLRALARYARRFDLVLTYNWGAFDMVMARRLFGGPPLVHHEDGFNADEAERLNRKRNLYRRVGLPAAHRLVVPSQRLETIARTVWKQRHVARIPNGIPVKRFAQAGAAIPGFARRESEVVIGTAAGLRAVKNLPRLVRAVDALGERPVRLIIVGQGPERNVIEAEADRLGISDRLLMPGFLARPQEWIGAFDIFALSSHSEQFPISLVEAMAAGLPVVATAVGDIPNMVAEENRALVVPPSDEAAFAKALARLADDAALRHALGEANRRKARAAFDEDAMISAYARLYGEAMGRPGVFRTD
jgi:L-malate glycosyltransferase